jgi:hypothetical protein
MQKVITLFVIAFIACTAIGTWAAANSREQALPRIAALPTVNPIAVMQASSTDLPHEQFDAY